MQPKTSEEPNNCDKNPKSQMKRKISENSEEIAEIFDIQTAKKMTRLQVDRSWMEMKETIRMIYLFMK